MLNLLFVKNFALIDEAEIEFSEGLNVLTGETGAGKSILIDALSGALGARSGAEMIRSGADSAYTELLFTVSPEKEEALRCLGVECEEGALIISRKILPNRSIHRINDESVTAAKVRAVTELLLDIHGQHEHQSLLKNARQLEILDEFAGEEAARLKAETADAWKRFQEAGKRTESFSLPEEERLRRLDFLQYELDEIRTAAVYVGEREDLEARFHRMHQFDKLQNRLGQTLNALDEGDASAADALSRALRGMRDALAADPALQSVSEELQTAEDLVSSVSHELREYLSELSFDPSEYAATEKRLDLLNRLELKYGDLSRAGSHAAQDREEEISRLNRYEEEREEARKEKEKAWEQLNRLCEQLHKEREKAAPVLEKAVIRALSELSFLSVSFLIELKHLPQPGPNGQDEAEYLISLNPGQEPAPLAKAASGGELSRIMLAIKTVMADKDRIPTVIFDEIDSGISGRTAQAVGEKLKEISRSRQVILITHLAQIAAPADRHIGIEKWTDGERTYTGVKVLNEEESVRELARLLGGSHVSESVLRSAEELKKGQRS